MFKHRKALSTWIAGATAVLALAGIAYAEVLFNQQIPISGTIVDPCSGDLLTYNGSLHEVVHITANPNGGLHYDDRINVDSFSLTDTVTGANYSTHDSFKTSFNANAGGTYTETDKETFALISHGGAANYKASFLFHVTVNPDGTITSLVDNVSVTCQ